MADAGNRIRIQVVELRYLPELMEKTNKEKFMQLVNGVQSDIIDKVAYRIKNRDKIREANTVELKKMLQSDKKMTRKLI